MKDRKIAAQEKITQHDKRKIKTCRQLVKALCELTREKPLYRITVQELSAAAGVSRGTFYLHFSDIFDMYEKLEADVLENISAWFQEYLAEFTDEAYKRFLVNVVGYVDADRDLFRLLFSMTGFRKQLTAILDDFYLETWKKFHGQDMSIKLRESLLFYHTHGILACVDKWLNEEPAASKEELLDLLNLLDEGFDELTEKNRLQPSGDQV